MTDILFIAFEFPPLNRGGVHRPLAFVKQLPQFGFRPIVLTLAAESYNEIFDIFNYDETLGKEIPDSVVVVPIKAKGRPKMSKLGEFISIFFSIHGNEAKYWKDNFKIAIEQVFKKYDPKVVFATVPPFGVLPIVTKMAQQYMLPLVLDFRDAWSQWRTVPYGSVLHYLRTLSFENKYLANADAVITTSKQTMEDFKRLHKNIPSDKFYYIPNGFNGDLLPWQPIDPVKEVITIGYVGSFYYSPLAREQMLKPWWKKKGHRILQYIPQKQDWLYRSPYFFFKALSRLNKEYPEWERKIRVKFIGKKPDWLREMVAEFGLERQVELMGELSYQESLLFQQKCDALLITSAKLLGGKDYSIAGKTFEYLQMQRPVIAFVCEGAQKELLNETGIALICDPDDSGSSAKRMYQLFSGHIALQPAKESLNTLSRKSLTGKLSELIARVIENHYKEKGRTGSSLKRRLFKFRKTGNVDLL